MEIKTTEEIISKYGGYGAATGCITCAKNPKKKWVSLSSLEKKYKRGKNDR